MNAAEQEGYKLAQAGYGLSDLWNSVTDHGLRDFNSVLGLIMFFGAFSSPRP